jgi:hypothetical protein
VPVRWSLTNPTTGGFDQLKRRLRSVRGLPTDRTAQVVIPGYSFVPNLRRAVLLDDDQIIREHLTAGQKGLQPLPDLRRCRAFRLKAVSSSDP